MSNNLKTLVVEISYRNTRYGVGEYHISDQYICGLPELAVKQHEDQNNGRTTRPKARRSLSDLPLRVCIYTIAIEPSLGCHAMTARVRPFSGLIWAT